MAPKVGKKKRSKILSIIAFVIIMILYYWVTGEDGYSNTTGYDEYYSSSPIFYSRCHIHISRSCRTSTQVASNTIAQAQSSRGGGGGSFGGGRSFGGGGGGHGGR